MHEGKVWTLRPVIVVRDEADVVALYMPHGAIWRGAVDLHGETLRVPWEEWRLGPPKRWVNHVLGLNVPGEPYAVSLIWTEAWHLLGWYVNVQQPLTRGEFGFDYMDWTLDVTVSPDLAHHELKDEDELEEAVRRGVYTPEHSARIREAAARGVERLVRREPPFDERWEDWRPDPAWPIPVLSDRYE